MFRRAMFRSPRSTEPTYVQCRPARSARASCDRPISSRRARTRRPNSSVTAVRCLGPVEMSPRSGTSSETRDYGRYQRPLMRRATVTEGAIEASGGTPIYAPLSGPQPLVRAGPSRAKDAKIAFAFTMASPSPSPGAPTRADPRRRPRDGKRDHQLNHVAGEHDGSGDDPRAGNVGDSCLLLPPHPWSYSRILTTSTTPLNKPPNNSWA